MTDNSFKPPVRTKLDALHTIGRAALSSVPFAGATLAELFQYFLSSPLEKRRNEWMDRVGDVIDRLVQNGLDAENLQSNPAFVTAVGHASQIALREHREEKLSALANAIENIGSGLDIDDDVQSIFFDLIDRYTPLHLRILKFAQSPPEADFHMGSLAGLLTSALPELNGKRELCDIIWGDLKSNGLVNAGNLHTMISGHGLSEKRTTRLGDELIRFISGNAGK